MDVSINLSSSYKFISQYRNCRILRNHRIVLSDLWVCNGKIIDPEKLFFDERIGPNIQIDCHDAIIAPGYIDVQLNGAFGIDFSNANEDIEKGVNTVAKGILEHGVTSFCPTLVTIPRQSYHVILSQIKLKPGGLNGAGVLGVHCEGPFISKKMNGAHPYMFIQEFNNGPDDVLHTYGSLDNIALVTLAPELPRSDEVIAEFIQKGIAVSIGHSVANLVQGENAVRHGATFITHLFNAMLPFHHRDPHLVGLLTSKHIPPDRQIFFGLIADGIHTHAAALRIAHRVNPHGIVLVTDAITAMGLPEGVYKFGENNVQVKGQKATLVGTETLAGSISSMDKCVQIFAKEAMCSLEFALEAASLHPAQLLGITNTKGTLDYGTDADFIFVNDDLQVLATYIAGHQVWKRFDVILKEISVMSLTS